MHTKKGFWKRGKEMDSAIRRGAVVALVGSVLGAWCVRGDLIASWDFNDSNLIVDQGGGILTTTFLSSDVGYLAGTAKNAWPGVVAGQALRLDDRVNNGVGRLDFAVNTTGYRGLFLSLSSQKTSTGFNSNQISYSANGGANFSNFGLPFNPPSAFDVSTFDLSAISSLDDNANAVLRITFAGAGTASGNNRIDNVQFTASAVATPEPSTGVLAGLGALVFALCRRGKRKKHRATEGTEENSVVS